MGISNHRLSVMAGKNSAQEDIFKNSGPGTTYGKVYNNNIEEN